MSPRYDLLVVGGGILGLWIARFAHAAGLKVALADSQHCGAGASGGVLGALMPHLPTGWSAKKQFQFDALVELGDLLAEVEAETGVATGYRRCGRIVPIRKTQFLAEAERRAEASAQRWGTFRHEKREADEFAGWIAAEAAPLGVLSDDLSARLSPQRTIAALKAAVAGRIALFEGWTFTRYDQATGTAHPALGDPIAAGRVVVAAGVETFALLAPVIGATIGAAIKGQAAVLQPAQSTAAWPIIFDGGTYVVPHDDGSVAVGSTTEASFDDPVTTDARIDEVIVQARVLCPALADAPVVARWAGLRPKCHERDPIVGILPDAPGVAVATGGFKITFGIAHRLARWLVDEIAGAERRVCLPPEFGVERHLNAAAARKA